MSSETNIAAANLDVKADILKEKLRTEGLNTVSRLLHEARAENRQLKDRTAQLERSLDIVNTKLQKAGVSETSKSGPTDEKPLPSKHLVEGLIKENSRLKQQVEHPHKVEELSLHVYSLQSQIQSLRGEKDLLRNEVESLQQQMSQSPDMKDQRIKLLTDQLQNREYKYKQEYERNQVLSREVSELKEQLQETARQCLNVSNKLPVTARTDSDMNSSPAAATMMGPPRDHQTPAVLDKNNELANKCGKLEQELEHTRNQLSVRSAQQTRATSPREQQLQEENSRLKFQLTEKQREIEALKEQQRMLQHQIEVYQDDFRHEKTDKQRAIDVNTELREQLRRVTNSSPSQSAAAGSSNAWDSRQTTRISQRQTQPTSKVLDTVVDDNISVSSQTEVLRPARLENRLTQLACYKCGKGYTADTHSDLVEHLSTCRGAKG